MRHSWSKQKKLLSLIFPRPLQVPNANLHPSGEASSVRYLSTENSNIVKSKLPDIPSYASQISVQELLSSVRLPDSLSAFECVTTGLIYKRGDLFRYSKSFGAALLKSGLKRGDIVGVLLPNCPQYAVVSLGLLYAGIVASCMNPMYTADELKLLLSQAEVKAIITTPELVPVVQTLKNGPCGASIRHVITLGAAEGCHNFSDMLNTDYSSAKFIQGNDINPLEEPAIIYWSSGTTGPPKGTILTHANICSHVLARSIPQVSGFTPGKETITGVIPFFHVFGGTSLTFTAIYQGSKVVSLEKFESTLFAKLLQVHKPSYLFLVPPLVSFVASSPIVTRDALANAHAVVCGGAPSGPALINRFLEKAGKYIFFQEGYGMTETSGMSHVLLEEHKNTKINSIGPPVSNTSCKVIDLETGIALGPNQNGEICVKGPQVMKGYINNEVATKNTIDSDGWLHSGDVGYYTDEGLFYISDRIKELIKVKGLQVAPAELEDLLRSHVNVEDVAVIGVPDERAGELPRAYIVRKNPSATADDIHQFLKEKVSAHKQLKGGIEFVDSIPKSASGKCLRRKLLEDYRNKTGSL